MGTIEKRGKNSWRIGTQVQTENGWEWVRDTIHFPGSMTEAKQRKEAEKALDIDALMAEKEKELMAV